MKKNLMSVLIMALVMANLVLTAILMISVVPQTKKANELVTKVCSAIDLELEGGKDNSSLYIPMSQVEPVSLSEGASLTINLKDSKDGEKHHAVISVTLALDTKSEGYKTYGVEGITAKQDIIKSEIMKIKDKNIRDFLFVAFSETIRFVSNRRNGEFKMFRMPIPKVEKFEPDVINEFTTILNRNIGKMNSFVEACKEINNNTKVSIFNSNATTLENVPDNSVDLVITSPPYGDSRTTVAYGEYSRLSLQWLDLFKLNEREIMELDKTLLGGNKFRNGFEFTIPSQTLRSSLEHIKDVDLERAGDVYSFYLDLEKSIQSISKKTILGGYHFWVVGNRTVKGETLLTDQIISEIAKNYGLKHIYTIDRNIINKVMPSLNSPTNETGKKSSTMTNEHIVVLRKI